MSCSRFLYPAYNCKVLSVVFRSSALDFVLCAARDGVVVGCLSPGVWPIGWLFGWVVG